MKKVLALILALVFVLSLVACGNDKEEQDKVNSALQGSWSIMEKTDTYKYTWTFSDGNYTFESVDTKNSDSRVAFDEGSYKIDTSKNEILCEYGSGSVRTLSYQYDNETLTISDSNGVFTKN